jgi:small subunit ribosomal protein S8
LDWAVGDARVGTTLTLSLKYGPNRERSIAGIKRVSKPGLRVYAKSTEIPNVLGGLGVAILSTSSGLLTDREAMKKGVGGEVLAYVW